MPVTARLSRAFYEKLGDDIANELVSWFNAVDLTYRTELRELNELNFARFDARVGERLAELKAELRREWQADLDARFGRLEPRFEPMDAKLDSMDTRLDRIDARLDSVDAWLAKMDSRLDRMGTKFDVIDVRLDRIDGRLEKHDERFTRLELAVRDAKVSTIRWMFGFWIGTGAMVMGWLLTRWLTGA